VVITEVRIKLAWATDERVRAYASIAFDDSLLVRGIRLVETPAGLMLSMPSRKLCDRCPACGAKNHLRARYCNECGRGLADDRFSRDDKGRADLFADVAHPLDAATRDTLLAAVVAAWEREKEAAKSPGYVCSYDQPKVAGAGAKNL
jgi:stage V sporulation protein G